MVTGCVSQVGEQSFNIGRTAWLSAGLPLTTAATTVDAQCGSSQQATSLATSLVGSGTIANEDTSKGASCFAEQRVVETLRDGKPSTPFMSFGDVVRIEMLDAAGNSIFGAIEQRIEQAARP